MIPVHFQAHISVARSSIPPRSSAAELAGNLAGAETFVGIALFGEKKHDRPGLKSLVMVQRIRQIGPYTEKKPAAIC